MSVFKNLFHKSCNFSYEHLSRHLYSSSILVRKPLKSENEVGTVIAPRKESKERLFSFITFNNLVKKFYSNSCKGKSKPITPCENSCLEEEKIPEPEKNVLEDKFKKACAEWKAKKGLISCQTICKDLKEKQELSCGMDGKKIPMDAFPKSKHESSPGSSNFGLVPARDEPQEICPEKPEEQQHKCSTGPVVKRYLSVDPSSYLDVPKCPKTKKVFRCGLIPKDSSTYEKGPCGVLPKKLEAKKKPKVKLCKGRPKCQGPKCKPVRLIMKQGGGCKEKSADDEEC